MQSGRDVSGDASATDSLAGDASYLSLVAEARDWTSTPGQDVLLRTIHTAGGDYVRPGVGGYTGGHHRDPSRGEVGRGHRVRGGDRRSALPLTHTSVLFCTSEYGAFGEMRWLALYDSAAAVDAAAEAIAKDKDYGQKLDAAGHLFVEGLARRTLARRIA